MRTLFAETPTANDELIQDILYNMTRSCRGMRRGRKQKCPSRLVVADAVRRLNATNWQSQSLATRQQMIRTLSAFETALSSEMMHNLLDRGEDVSLPTLEGLLQALREARRPLEPTWNNLQTRNTEVSTVALNIYLAHWCDRATGKDRSEYSDGLDPLSQAQGLLQNYTTIADDVSYATVLQAMSRCGVDVKTVWQKMLDEDIEPNCVAWNALLSASKQPLSIHRRMVKAGVKPDGFTLDVLLVPLLRANRASEAEEIVHQLLQLSRRRQEMSHSFSAWLLTVVNKAGDVDMAHSWLRKYVLQGPVAPCNRHFNILLQGYASRAARLRVNETFLFQNATAHQEAWKLYHALAQHPRIRPDAFTVSTMMPLCASPEDLTWLLTQSSEEFGIVMNGPLMRSAMTQYGQLGDASSAAAWICRRNVKRDARNMDVLFLALAECVKLNVTSPMSVEDSIAAKSWSTKGDDAMVNAVMAHLLDDMTPYEAMRACLHEMSDSKHLNESLQLPRPTSKAFCLVASAAQRAAPGQTSAMELFRSAMELGIPADGRFVNAIFRCFGDEINKAIDSWRDEIRAHVVEHEDRKHSSHFRQRVRGKNLVAAYNGLMFVSGRALRPDIALRIAYAMQKEDLEPNELSLNCYHSGKRSRNVKNDMQSRLAAKLGEITKIVASYESLLYVECSNYDEDDRRRAKEKRVRIIV